MISEEKKMIRRILKGILGNYRTNYLTEFDLFKNILLIDYIFCAKIFSKVDVRR